MRFQEEYKTHIYLETKTRYIQGVNIITTLLFAPNISAGNRTKHIIILLLLLQ